MKTSVLINNYNNGQWLQACIESVLQQTQPPSEIIVYDDGSSDNSLEILRGFGDSIDLIAGIRRQGHSSIANQANAINQAFRQSSGSHIYLLDGDDVFFPNKIAAYEAAWARAPECLVVHAPTTCIDEQGATGRVNNWQYKQAKNYLARTYELHDCDLYYSTSALACHRDHLARHLPLDFSDGLAMAADERLASIAPLSGEVLFLPVSYTGWRQRPNSLWRTNPNDAAQEMLMRNRYFNRHAHALGARPLLLWHNRLFVRQVVRKVTPKVLEKLYKRLAPNRIARP